MEKIESNQVERVLRDDELETVNGGFGFVERFTNPLLIYGFNPQPVASFIFNTTTHRWDVKARLQFGAF